MEGKVQRTWKAEIIEVDFMTAGKHAEPYSDLLRALKRESLIVLDSKQMGLQFLPPRHPIEGRSWGGGGMGDYKKRVEN